MKVSEQAFLRGVSVPVGKTARWLRRNGYDVPADVPSYAFVWPDDSADGEGGCGFESQWTGYTWAVDTRAGVVLLNVWGIFSEGIVEEALPYVRWYQWRAQDAFLGQERFGVVRLS